MNSVKCVIVGDGAVGKTALVITYVNGLFPGDYLPTVADEFQKNVFHNGAPCILSIWDTAGQENYQRLRSLSYPDTDVFLFAYSTNSKVSFFNIRDKWIPEVQHYVDEPLMLLVGTKTDLRVGNSEEMVSTEMGEAMLHNSRMHGFVECSAKLNQGVDDVFQKVLSLVFEHRQSQIIAKKKPKRKCVIM